MTTISVREKPEKEDELFESVRKYFQNESCDFSGNKDEKQELEDELAMRQFKNSIEYVPSDNASLTEPPGRYSVALPWKTEAAAIELPNNFGLTIGRLRSALKRLRAKPSLMTEYDETFKDQIKSGILERVFKPRQADGPRIYYVPHQPVIKETSSTTKLRVVLDHSSGDPSLNELLLRGKVYAGKDDKAIMSFICRVRLMPIVLSCDLARAFHQILLKVSDRDVTRVMWPDDPMSEDEPKIYRFTRVSFGLGPAPFLLGATLEHHLEKSTSPWAKKLI